VFSYCDVHALLSSGVFAWLARLGHHTDIAGLDGDGKTTLGIRVELMTLGAHSITLCDVDNDSCRTADTISSI